MDDEQRATLAEMDAAAEQALAKLKADAMTDANTKAAVLLVANWVKIWYMKAGYKRLMKGLLALAKEL